MSTTTHDLKCWPEHFGPVVEGVKTVELRKNDRDYQIGDYLLLREFRPNQPHQGPGSYTGRIARVRVTHITRGFPWLAPGYVAMSIRLENAE